MISLYQKEGTPQTNKEDNKMYYIKNAEGITRYCTTSSDIANGYYVKVLEVREVA